MLNRYAEWGSGCSALPRITPSILLTCHLITSGLAFIITNAKPDFAPFEDSRSSNRSIIVSQNNYVALKGREKRKIKNQAVGFCFLVTGTCPLPMHAVWGRVSRRSQVASSPCPPLIVVFVPVSRSGSHGAPPSSPVPFSPALRLLTFQSEHEPLQVQGTWRRTGACEEVLVAERGSMKEKLWVATFLTSPGPPPSICFSFSPILFPSERGCNSKLSRKWYIQYSVWVLQVLVF